MFITKKLLDDVNFSYLEKNALMQITLFLKLGFTISVLVNKNPSVTTLLICQSCVFEY